MSGTAAVSSDSSWPISSAPFRYRSSSTFSTSGFSRLFLIRIFLSSLDGGGHGCPFFSYSNNSPYSKLLFFISNVDSRITG